jgi:adenylate cyclase
MITKAVFAHGGTLDKFIGDAAMVLFNAPFDQPDYEMAAIRAGIAVLRGAAQISERIGARLGREVLMGIGIHCGPAMVGNIGTSLRMDYTAIGDTVNTAARLENAAQPGCVVISDMLYRRLGGRVIVESIGELGLKGKANRMPCYNVTGIAGESEKANL